eukprot:c13631_g1_i1.p1 GENE.c13631_g1_i1~~c13631_g1_i1.p1  ORF type:complete len:492 (-),score=107.37 c13631_g1_i1:172-1647(-)
MGRSTTMLVWGLSAKTFAILTLSGWLTMILTTYSFCVSQTNCPKFLPTISATWVYPPENYISRVGVSLGCLAIAIIQFFLYAINQPLGIRPTLILGLGLVGVFSLSWVGAICDSTVSSCDGNPNLHTSLALIFFIFYDISMVIMISGEFTLRKLSGTPTKFHLALHILCLMVSLFSKARYFLTDDTWLAVLEWTDVATILTFTADYVFHLGAGLSVGFVTTSSFDSFDETNVFVINAPNLLKISYTIWTFLLTSSMLSAVHKGTVHPTQTWPLMDDMWTAPPGNFVSRWGIVMGNSFAVIAHVVDYFASKPRQQASSYRPISPSVSSSTSHTAILPSPILLRTAIAVLSLACCSVSAAINKSENQSLHDDLATAFYFGYSAYAVLTVLASMPSHISSATARILFTCLGIACKARYSPDFKTRVGTSACDAMEWIDLISALGFMWSEMGKESDFGFGVVNASNNASSGDNEPLLSGWTKPQVESGRLPTKSK